MKMSNSVFALIGRKLFGICINTKSKHEHRDETMSGESDLRIAGYVVAIGQVFLLAVVCSYRKQGNYKVR